MKALYGKKLSMRHGSMPRPSPAAATTSWFTISSACTTHHYVE
jgi:hypothetical protein